MARHTRQPDVLQELFEALGNDPFVIAECLARPGLAERMLRNWYARDQRIHGELKRRAETELQTRASLQQMNSSAVSTAKLNSSEVTARETKPTATLNTA